MAPDSQGQRPSNVGAAAPPVNWGVATRIGFRFAFTYLALYMFPFPLDYLYDVPDPWEKLVPWLARHIFHLAITTPYGGDSLYGYARNVYLVALAIILAVAWSLLDRKRANYASLHSWLRLWVRAYLGVIMIGFGMVKVLPFQMLPPSLSKLLARLGDMSPQALLWAFMGSSTAYTRFAGLAEVLGGVLLFVPPLTTLGALVSAGALTHVFVINMSYDVSVKLNSFNFLLMSLFLIGPELGRLADILVFNRRVEPANWAPLLRSRWMRGALFVIQLAFCSYVLVDRWVDVYPRHKNFDALPQTVPFYGIWTVDDFVLDGQPRPPLITDTFRWQQVIFDAPDSSDVPFDRSNHTGMAIMSMSGSRRLYWMQFDLSKNVIALMKLDDTQGVIGADFLVPPFQPTAWLGVENPKPELLIMDGGLDGRHIHATLHRIQPNFILRSRGFHWINDRPFWGR